MKLIDLVNARKALDNLCSLRFSSFSKARALSRLKKSVYDEVMFFSEQENKIIDLYSKKDENGTIQKTDNGRFVIATDKVPNYLIDINELKNTEVELDKVSISASDFLDAADYPTPEDMMLLDCIIDWED